MPVGSPEIPTFESTAAQQRTGLLIGVAVTLPALIVAFLSGGMGHGDYVAMRLLYPVPMALTLLTDDSITPTLFFMMVGQFPLYGWLLLIWRIPRVRIALGVILVVHVLATVVCFGGFLPNFS